MNKNLHEIWKRIDLDKEIRTQSGEVIAVLDRGIENAEANGPDFKNARIRMGLLTYVGDIQLDSGFGDWKEFGRNLDAKFDRVILQASLNNPENGKYVFSREGRKICCLSMKGLLTKEEAAKFSGGRSSDQKKRRHLKCSESQQSVSVDSKRAFLTELGLKRFRSRAEKIEEGLKRDNNFEETLYQLCMENLMPSRNKEMLRSISGIMSLKYIKGLKPERLTIKEIEAILFNVAGLLDPSEKPEESGSEYFQELQEISSSLLNGYDGKKFSIKSWKIEGRRIRNYPHLGLASSARLVDGFLYEGFIGRIIGLIQKEAKPIRVINGLRSMFILKARGYWSTHYSFSSNLEEELKYLTGLNQADEIAVNAVLPCLYAFYSSQSLPEEKEKVGQIYGQFIQRIDSKMLEELAEDLDIKSDKEYTALSQGTIELFRSFCLKNKCGHCEIGKQAFS